MVSPAGRLVLVVLYPSLLWWARWSFYFFSPHGSVIQAGYYGGFVVQLVMAGLGGPSISLVLVVLSSSWLRGGLMVLRFLQTSDSVVQLVGPGCPAVRPVQVVL
jgi:hypothetical protein